MSILIFLVVIRIVYFSSPITDSSQLNFCDKKNQRHFTHKYIVACKVHWLHSDGHDYLSTLKIVKNNSSRIFMSQGGQYSKLEAVQYKKRKSPKCNLFHQIFCDLKYIHFLNTFYLLLRTLKQIVQDKVKTQVDNSHFNPN